MTLLGQSPLHTTGLLYRIFWWYKTGGNGVSVWLLYYARISGAAEKYFLRYSVGVYFMIS